MFLENRWEHRNGGDKKMSIHDKVHCRWHPFEKLWILISPHRLNRVWVGKKHLQCPTLPVYDPDCPFCPGNIRVDGKINPQKASAYPFAFDNAFPAILPFEGRTFPMLSEKVENDIYRSNSVYGMSRIVGFHPQHNLTFALMSSAACQRVVKLWQKEYQELGQIPYVKTVNIFENSGFGSSLPHPHNQIICSSEIPSYLGRVLETLRDYQELHNKCLLCRTQEEEICLGKRIVYQNSDFVAFVPYWAIWPFEVWVVARKHQGSLADFNNNELANLALVYQTVTTKLDNLFEAPCPYSSAIYQTPTDNLEHPEIHFHLVFRPPVLRGPEVWKWMVGYELMAQPQRDLTPEQAAKLLQKTADLHYSKKK